jgi:hypothetical protein
MAGNVRMMRNAASLALRAPGSPMPKPAALPRGAGRLPGSIIDDGMPGAKET